MRHRRHTVHVRHGTHEHRHAVQARERHRGHPGRPDGWRTRRRTRARVDHDLLLVHGPVNHHVEFRGCADRNRHRRRDQEEPDPHGHPVHHVPVLRRDPRRNVQLHRPRRDRRDPRRHDRSVRRHRALPLAPAVRGRPSTGQRECDQWQRRGRLRRLQPARGRHQSVAARMNSTAPGSVETTRSPLSGRGQILH